MGDILDYVLFNWRWFAGPLVLAAIVLGLLYKWNLTIDALAGATGALLGVMLADLAFVLVAPLVIGASVPLLVEIGAHPAEALLVGVVLAVHLKLVLLLNGGVGGCVVGIGMSCWRRWRSSRGQSEPDQLLACHDKPLEEV